MNSLRKLMKIFGALLCVLIALSVFPNLALAGPPDEGTVTPPLTEFPGPYNSPSWEQTVDNGDGTLTYSQVVNYISTPPHYLGPWYGGSYPYLGNYGFGIYSWYDQDYGWQHDFPAYSTTGLLILESTLTIRAWDVDSEVFHGTNGEFDGVTGDGVWLNPQYLQGSNGTWSVTVFNVAQY